jgi:hypothetical protein
LEYLSVAAGHKTHSLCALSLGLKRAEILSQLLIRPRIAIRICLITPSFAVDVIAFSQRCARDAGRGLFGPTGAAMDTLNQISGNGSDCGDTRGTESPATMSDSKW